MYTPLWGATETTFHLSEKWKNLNIDAWDNFDNNCKNIFCILNNEVRNQKISQILLPLKYILEAITAKNAQILKNYQKMDF